MTRTGRIVTTLGAALAGATVGYVAGVLSAPASGHDIRRRLGRKLEHETDQLVHRAEDTLKKVQHRISDAMHS